MKKISVVLFLSGLMISAGAYCATSANASVSGDAHQGLQAAYDQDTDVVTDLVNGDYTDAAQAGMNVIVAEGIQELRDSDEGVLADQLQTEWANQFIGYFLSSHLSTFELGDHDPLSPWLTNFYNILFTKTKGLVRSIRLIDDVEKMNFALNVVFHPVGNWRANVSYDADRVEYRKHFIPMSNIITYWVTLETCKHYASSYGQLCGDGATELEKLMGRYIAPRVSDYVFAQANGQDNDFSRVDAMSQYPSEQEFEAQIINQSR
jgi:hypothetical protein